MTGTDHMNAQLCQWFALCTRPANGTESHPIIGEVPICDRCREKNRHLAGK